MTKPIMSIKILEDFTTYTDADDDWITEYVPEAWEAREVLNYITELEALVQRLVEAGEKMQALIGWSTGDEATKDWDALVKDWKER